MTTKSPRLLLVEDDDLIRNVTRMRLEKFGWSVDTAADGAAGLTLWRDHRHSLVLVDLHMPKMGGFEMAAHIRAEETVQGATEIVLLTADVSADIEARCRDAGIDQYMSKPLSNDRFKELLETHQAAL